MGAIKQRIKYLDHGLSKGSVFKRTHLCHFKDRSSQAYQRITQCTVINVLK